MGAYTSIRGWMGWAGLNYGGVAAVRDLLNHAPEEAEAYGLPRWQAEFYGQGWIVPTMYINATHYIFYGADIRTEAVPYLRAVVESVARVRDDDPDYPVLPKGLFHLDEDGTYGHPPRTWELEGGRLNERAFGRAKRRRPYEYSQWLSPTTGWDHFSKTSLVIEVLWRRLRNWTYLNLTSNTSVWEAPEGQGYTVFVAFEEGRVCELIVNPGSTGAKRNGTIDGLLSELSSRFAIQRERRQTPWHITGG
jgi:hypothetical protein